MKCVMPKLWGSYVASKTTHRGQFSLLLGLNPFVDFSNCCVWFCVSAQAQQSTSGAAASNSHSTAASSDPPKATFPAYTQSSVSSSSSTSASNSSSSPVAKPPATVTNKPATLTTTSATSKLIHPDEDISLVSLLLFSTFTFYTVSSNWYIWRMCT